MPIKVSGLGFKPFCRSPDPRCSALSDTFTERKWSKGQREFTAVQSLTCRVMTFYLFVLEPLIRPSWFPVAQTWSVTCRGETSPTLKLKKKALVVRLGGFGVKKLSITWNFEPPLKHLVQRLAVAVLIRRQVVVILHQRRFPRSILRTRSRVTENQHFTDQYRLCFTEKHLYLDAHSLTLEVKGRPEGTGPRVEVEQGRSRHGQQRDDGRGRERGEQQLEKGVHRAGEAKKNTQFLRFKNGIQTVYVPKQSTSKLQFIWDNNPSFRWPSLAPCILLGLISKVLLLIYKPPNCFGLAYILNSLLLSNPPSQSQILVGRLFQSKLSHKSRKIIF